VKKDDLKQTEIQKLLHFLQVKDESHFSFLQKLNKDELHQLRLTIIDVSQFTQTDIWKRLTGVAKYFPNYMNAKISETVMGPLIAANMSYYMPEKDAIAIMKYMSTSFLATVSEYMTPEKAQHLINQIPMDIGGLVFPLCFGGRAAWWDASMPMRRACCTTSSAD